MTNSRSQDSKLINNYTKNQKWCLKTDCVKKTSIFLKKKLSETISKPKELRESLKTLIMQNKTVIFNFNVIEKNDTLTYETFIFQNF